MDHAELVHAQGTQAARMGMSLLIKRVDTHDNIAELSSHLVDTCYTCVGAVAACVVLFVQEFGLVLAMSAKAGS